MSKKLAQRGAISFGINMDVDCAWIGPPDNEGFTPFGPDVEKDNIFQNLPQVNLHGMDEGLTLKMCVSILQATIAEATTLRKMNATSVSNVTQICFTESLMGHFLYPFTYIFMYHFKYLFLYLCCVFIMFHVMYLC